MLEENLKENYAFIGVHIAEPSIPFL